VVSGKDFEGLPTHQAPLEVFLCVFDAAFHTEGREMRS
jgi:hypothetical protein